MREGWAGILSNDFFIIMSAFLAGPEKTPAKMDRTPLVSFKDHPEYVLFIEKKLKSECFMVDLIGFSAWEACYFHGIGNNYGSVGAGFQGNVFHGPQAGRR